MTAENKNKNNRLSRWVKIPAYILLGVILLLVVARISLKSVWVQNWVKNYVVEMANEELTAELQIEKMSGDLWHKIEIKGITLVAEDTVASIDSLNISYDITSYFGDLFHIREIAIRKPNINIIEEGETWNIARLTTPSEAPEDEAEPFPFQISNVQISDGFIHLVAPSVLEDSSLQVTKTFLNGSLTYYGDLYDAGLKSLSFQLENTRLGSPVTVDAAASADENTITLERLIFATGQSLLKTSAKIQQEDSVVALSLQGEPVAWQDIAAYSRDMPLDQNLEVDFGIKGTFNEIEAELGVKADGLDSLRMSVGVKRDSTFSFQYAEIDAKQIDPAILLGDTTLPALTGLEAEFTGNIALADYRTGSGKLNFSVNELRMNPYSLSSVTGNMDLQESSLNGNFEASNGRQRFISALQAANIWEEQPDLSLKLKGQNISPAYWTQDEEFTGILNFDVTASGKGWYPQERQWSYSLNLQNSWLMEQEVQEVTLRGKFNPESITANGFVKLIESRLDVDVVAANLNDVPEYDYDLSFDQFDISELAGNEEYTSAITGKLSGMGRGYTPETMKMKSHISISSSVINGEFIDNLSGDFRVQDTTLIIEDARLESTIADGKIDAGFHLLRRYDRENNLSFNLELKEVDPLASLVGADSLKAEGTLEGTLNPVQENELKFAGNVDLQNLIYDNINSDRAQGDIEIIFREQTEYDLDVNLTRPALPAVVLQDLRLRSNGSIPEEGPRGRFKLQFTSTQEGEIIHSGFYSVSPDTTTIEITQLDITSSLRTLSLEEPFSVILANQSIRTDTMRVASADDSAILELAVPYADSARQTGYLRGESLNTTVIQNTLLSEAFFEGFLSGELQFTREDTVLNATGDLVLSEFNYKGSRFDTLRIATEIHDERLKGKLFLTESGQHIIEGNADVPFKLGDPEQFDDTFFEEPVSGELTIKPIALTRFQQLLDQSEIENTEGILSFRGTLEGRAGNPDFAANLSMKKAVLSGVSVDSLTANMNYHHDSSLLNIDASIVSLRQKAAEINAQIPLHIDLRLLEVDMPQGDDPITANIKTNRFDLAALNDFLDREQIRNINGELNGDVQIKGTVDNLNADGKLNLSGGSVRLVPAGITIDRIRSELVFEPDLLTLTNFTAQSGRGRLNAEGKIALEKLIPGEMDVRITASNFRALNTSEYNALINMDVQSRGSFTKPEVTGDLIFINGFVELDNFGEKSVEKVELDDNGQEGLNTSLYDSLALEMNVSFNRRFFIRNQRYLEMEIELEGEVDLIKESDKDLQLFGTVNTVSGYASPLGKRFELQEGSVAFAGEPSNPQLSVRTQYKPPQTQEEITIWYIIEGTVEDPKFVYESDPQMELENIISYTLFGQPFYALDSWKQVVASSGSNTTATDVALEVLLDRIETLATKRLGIDVVKIDNTRQGAESGTSITTGWYLNPKTFFAIQNVISGSTPDTGFLLEYMLQKNLKLIIRQENSSHQGVDLQWNFDY